MPARAAAKAVPGDLGVHMGVAVDKARRDDHPVGVDRLLGGGTDAADLDDMPVLDPDIGAIARAARAVHHDAVPDQQVEGHARSPEFLNRVRNIVPFLSTSTFAA